MRRFFILLAVPALLAASCSVDEEAAAPAPVAITSTTSATTTFAPSAILDEITLEVDGESRRYTLFVPASVADPAPLVIDLHGLSESADEQEARSSMRVKAAAEGFVVAQPRGRSAIPYWESSAEGTAVTGDVAFLRAVVDDVALQVSIDRARVYATGLSNGGGMANRLACEAADVFAAVAPVAGAYTQHEVCAPVRPVPMMIFHGDADPVVPYAGVGELFPPIDDYAAAWGARNECSAQEERQVTDDVIERTWSGCAGNAPVTLYIVEGGGHGWPGSTRPEAALVTTGSISATDLIWGFFAAHPMT